MQLEHLVLKPLDQNTILNFKECFDKNGSPKKLENLQWQYFNNPEQNCAVDIAIDKLNGKTAAIYALAYSKFKIGDNIVTGAQSLNTITDEEYLGTGLFIHLAKDVYEKVKTSVQIVYGFPNGNAILGCEKLLKWTVLDPVPFLIKPLRLKYFTKRFKFLKFFPNLNLSFSTYKSRKGFIIKEANYFPEDVNEIWNKFAKDINVCVHRNLSYLSWRYVQKPNENYKIVHCYKENNYIGFIVYTVKIKHEGKIGYIMELMYDPLTPRAGKLLLDYAVSKIKKEKTDCILSWCLEHSMNYNVFKKAFFFNLPEKLKPIELHFGAKAFNKAYETTIKDRKNWYISYSDSDTV